MNVLLAFIFLISGAMTAGMTTSLLQLGRLRSKEEFKKIPSLFFFQHFLKPFFRNRKWEGLFFTLSFSKHVLHLCYSVTTLFILLTQSPFIHAFKTLESHQYTFDSLWVLAIGVIIITLSLVADMLMKFLATAAPIFSLRLFAPVSSVFLLIFSPLTALLMKMLQSFFPESQKATPSAPSIREKILEVLYESDLSTHLDPQERKLILSVANFKERNVREVMVPRIDIVCLSEETTLQEASQLFLKERYSRLPVYQDNIDHIIGVLLYKDVLSAFSTSDRQESIRTLIKPVLYTPETKKISQLLQEFRSKQIHMAIVVDEYGGTEGIITTEDILEELVGEIADEDDVDQEVLYSILPSGGWIVDARMGILDIEKELAIQIPPSPEYDTLGGYIYHRAGAIPAKGWRLHHDDFDLEILSSDERSIEKVRIMPHLSQD
ncbi:MAG: HlyC/CorC family transporter [Verrucomicrobia bacterium]|nr:HlyC/CorC family transporter [Verrucomicrobiota bacterium]